jgi:hypothetical protein
MQAVLHRSRADNGPQFCQCQVERDQVCNLRHLYNNDTVLANTGVVEHGGNGFNALLQLLKV